MACSFRYENNFENIIIKVLWAFVILTMTGLGCFFVATNTSDYIQTRLVTNIESATADLSVSLKS